LQSVLFLDGKEKLAKQFLFRGIDQGTFKPYWLQSYEKILKTFLSKGVLLDSFGSFFVSFLNGWWW